jgi:hypothetical protein
MQQLRFGPADCKGYVPQADETKADMADASLTYGADEEGKEAATSSLANDIADSRPSMPAC